MNKPYRRYPPSAPNPLALVAVGLVLLIVAVAGSCSPDTQALSGPATFEGKPIVWWAMRAKQARADANARRRTIRQLRRTMAHDPTVREAIRLATVAYPALSERRAWAIVEHESWMTSDPVHAYNRTSVNGCHATGLFQFLDCTFNSTPYRGQSIYSPYAQALAAGWMHTVGRGCEWAIGPEC